MGCYLRYQLALLILLLFLNSGIGVERNTCWADIYKYIDNDGTVCFTDSPPANKRAIKVIATSNRKEKNINYNKRPVVLTSQRSFRDPNHIQLVHKIAEEYYIDPNLIKAVITAESNWDPFAISRKGAMGLMQLMPQTASLLNVKNPYDPEENIRAGIRYLKYLLDKFNGDLILAIAAYNAGPTVVERFGKIPPIGETLQYVKKVLSLSGYGIGESNSYRRLNLKDFRKKKEEIYAIRLADGSILYTNSGLTR
jgi:hypothetical protein